MRGLLRRIFGVNVNAIVRSRGQARLFAAFEDDLTHNTAAHAQRSHVSAHTPQVAPSSCVRRVCVCVCDLDRARKFVECARFSLRIATIGEQQLHTLVQQIEQHVLVGVLNLTQVKPAASKHNQRDTHNASSGMDTRFVVRTLH